MPAYKNQHFLPSGYLKYFSDDQLNCNRKSWVWRCDGEKMLRVPIDSQCFGKYLYSKENPAETEKIFQYREGIYCRFVDMIRTGQEPPGKLFGDFFLCMVDLHLRNAIHKNLTGQEGIDAYNLRINMFLARILVCKSDGDFSIPTVREHIRSFWRMEIIRAPADIQFVTSDHPSVFTTCRNSSSSSSGALHLILLPIDLNNVAVAFDKRFLWLNKGIATPRDMDTFNVGQIQNAESCIYSSRFFGEQELRSVQTIFAKKNPPNCEVTAESWKLTMQYLPPEHHFSFMRLKPPRF